MSFRARLLTSGALGGLSGVVIAVGMLALLAMPARAQAGGAGDQVLARIAMPGGVTTIAVALNVRPTTPT